MLLQEAQNLLKKTEINLEQLEKIDSLYILLDLDKEDFCKIVDVVGLEKLMSKQKHYERLGRAEQELRAKEKYLDAKRRLNEMDEEIKELLDITYTYEKKCSLWLKGRTPCT